MLYKKKLKSIKISFFLNLYNPSQYAIIIKHTHSGADGNHKLAHSVRVVHLKSLQGSIQGSNLQNAVFVLVLEQVLEPQADKPLLLVVGFFPDFIIPTRAVRPATSICDVCVFTYHAVPRNLYSSWFTRQPWKLHQKFDFPPSTDTLQAMPEAYRSNKIKIIRIIWKNFGAVSYTHLTLPTRRTV